MKLDEQKIRGIIGEVEDPDLNKPLGALGAVKNVDTEGDTAVIDIELIQPIHTAAEKINELCAAALEKAYPGIRSEINFREKPIDTKGREFLKKVKNIVAVSSGKGGVGKSAIAANLAAALSQTGAKVGVLDGDVYGPSQPTMFGLPNEPFEGHKTPEGKTVAYPHEKYGIKVASMGFVLNRDEAAIIRGPMLAGYFSMLFEQIDWGALDYLIFDLPPGTGDVQLTLTQKIPLTGAVVVTTPQEIALADVRRAIAMFRRVNVDILGIVENMSYFAPPDMPDKKYYIFGEGGGKEVAKEYGIPLIGEIPLDIKMREGNDGGKPFVLTEGEDAAKKPLLDMAHNMIASARKANYKLLEDSGRKLVYNNNLIKNK